MKLMIAGGGTGGHLFPGMAIASAWLARAPQPEVFFVGTERGLEKKLVPQAGLRLELIHQVGLKRTGFVQLLKGLLLLPKSLLQSLAIVRKERPNVALSVGGYAAGPAILAAWLLRVPTLVLEPNAVPGLTNRILARIARRAVSPYERARAYFGEKLVKAGIPVRPAVAKALRSHVEPTRTVLVFGGSQGARALNDAVVDAAPALSSKGIRLIHQTGARDYERIALRYAGTDVDVREFIDDMAAAYDACDLVVCRAGASSLAELTLLGKPSILIPLPTATDDHQTKNAQALADVGAALLLKQSELHLLPARIEALMQDPAALAAMGEKARSLGDPNAANIVCDMCVSLGGAA